MPYRSDAQRKFMHARQPAIARRWDREARTEEARTEEEDLTQRPDLKTKVGGPELTKPGPIKRKPSPVAVPEKGSPNKAIKRPNSPIGIPGNTVIKRPTATAPLRKPNKPEWEQNKTAVNRTNSPNVARGEWNKKHIQEDDFEKRRRAYLRRLNKKKGWKK